MNYSFFYQFFILRVGSFWTNNRALALGISALLGLYVRFFGPLPLLFPLALFFISLFRVSSLFWQNLIFCIATFFFAMGLYQFPEVPPEGVEGTATIKIKAVNLKPTSFGKQWLYHCTIDKFINTEGDEIARKIECSFAIPHKKNFLRPPSDYHYQIKATLHQNSNGNYYLKIDRKKPWQPVGHSWNLSEWRFSTKEKLKAFLRKKIENPDSSTFLAGLATGEFDDRMMQYDFARFGLQHIMAISGFHFALIAAILLFLFRLVMPLKWAAILVFLSLTCYFGFLGISASILRSWIMISIAFLGFYLERRGKALNTLGIALIGTILFDPLLTKSIAFQFSFLATAAILLLYAPCEVILNEILPKRTLTEMIRMNHWNQHAYCLLGYFRQGLALTMAVNALTFPLMLFHFHQFPWMSLFYNLFFPLLVTLSLFLLIVGLIFFPFGDFIHSLNSAYTDWMLHFTSHMPKNVDIYLHVPYFPLAVLCPLLTVSLLLSIIWHQAMKEDEYSSFNYI